MSERAPDDPAPTPQAPWIVRALLAAGFCTWACLAPIRESSDIVAVGAAILLLLLGLNFRNVLVERR